MKYLVIHDTPYYPQVHGPFDGLQEAVACHTGIVDQIMRTTAISNPSTVYIANVIGKPIEIVRGEMGKPLYKDEEL